MAQCGANIPGVDQCIDMHGGLYRYIETIVPPADPKCIPVGVGKVNAAHYHQFQVTKLNKTVGGKWAATLDGTTVTNKLVAFDKWVNIFEWAESSKKGGPGHTCTLPWGARVNVTTWQRYRVGVGWNAIQSQLPIPPACASVANGQDWHVTHSANENHFFVDR